MHRRMKKGILKFWLFLMIFYQTEIHEFLALPFFFHHYYETLQTHSNVSLIEFLEEHYIENAHHEPEHAKLPFKVHFYSLYSNFIGSDLLVSLKMKVIPPIYLKIPLLFENSTNEKFLNTIWQPPKHV